MIRFNIIGTGFLDLQESSGIAFKTENQQFRFADISLGRSVEFTVPATDHNRQMLGFAEDPAENGDMMRTSHPCQMVYDGGAILGTFEIHGYENKAFKCVFLMNNAQWINDLQNKKLSDCPQFWTKGVLWASNSTIYDANDAVLDSLPEGNAIVKYDNGMTVQTAQWQLVPSINLKRYIEDLLTTLGVTRTVSIPKNYWLVSASMKGGQPDSVTLRATNNNDADVLQTEGYLSTVDDYVYAASDTLFGFYTIVTNTCRWYKAEHNIKIMFDANFPQDVMMIGWIERSTYPHYKVYGDRYCFNRSGSWQGEPLANRTIEVAKGDMFQFFKPELYFNFGFRYVAAPYTINAIIERNDELEIGEVWQMRNNQPDMTVFEFLKSACVATGYELLVTADGVTITRGKYGEKSFKVCDNVVSVDSVTRCVDSWGRDTQDAEITFDSEDYVEEHITMDYPIDNENLSATKSFKAKFSEGSVGGNGILIDDWQASGGTYKLKARKWTIAYADPNKTYLQRVSMPDFVGYADIANESTCIRIKMRKPEVTFFDLKVTDVWLWRGMAYVWTDAQWSNGVLTMTLQKVSQQDFTVNSV